MVSSCDVLFCVGCRPQCTVPLVGAANVEIGFEIKVRSGIADLKIRSGRSSPPWKTTYSLIVALHHQSTPVLYYHEPERELICTICKFLFLRDGGPLSPFLSLSQLDSTTRRSWSPSQSHIPTATHIALRASMVSPSAVYPGGDVLSVWGGSDMGDCHRRRFRRRRGGGISGTKPVGDAVWHACRSPRRVGLRPRTSYWCVLTPPLSVIVRQSEAPI